MKGLMLAAPNSGAGKTAFALAHFKTPLFCVKV